jgi:hypothetical protein
MKTTTELIEAKGLTVDCFDELNEAISALEQNVERFKQIHNNLITKIKECDAYQESYDYLLPITEHDINEMVWGIEKTKQQYADGIQYIVKTKLKNVEMDSYEFKEYFKNQEKFDARKIMFHLFEKYGQDEEYLSLVNIQNDVRKALPKVNGTYWGDDIKNPEQLIKSSTKGYKFLTSNTHTISSILKFADIVIGNVKPSECESYYVSEGGKAYGGNIHALTRHKNRSVTLTFNSGDDCKKFAEAIFADPKELLKGIEENETI